MREVTELRYLILALQREGNRQLASDLRPLGLTPSQAESLRLLADREPLTLHGLGELLICESGTNPSRIVDRLVNAGFIQREANPEDRRQVLLTLTDHGREVAGQVATIEQQLEDRLADLIGDRPVGPALALLRAMATQVPAGQALDRRRSA